MSNYILCQIKTAEHPYYIESISTNIYSIEELCYYLYHNLYLVDQSILNEELCTWLQEELELPKLAARLRPKFSKFVSAEDVLYPIFKEINYLTYEELKALNVRLARLESEHPAIRTKKKGDTLIQNEMYVRAIKVYQKLLDDYELEEVRPGLSADVCHNLACAFSYLFQMEKAQEYFYKAYELEPTEESLKNYLLAYRSIHKPLEYISHLSELEVPDSVREEVEQAWDQFARKPEQQVYSQHIDSLLEKITRDYHRSTGA